MERSEDREILLVNGTDDDTDLELQQQPQGTSGTSNGNASASNGHATASTDDDLDLGPVSAAAAAPNPSSEVYVAACVAAVGGVLFGYDLGVISGAKTQMQRELGLSCAQIGALVAFLPLGGFFASLVGGEQQL